MPAESPGCTFTARLHASALYASALCPPVCVRMCPSVISRQSYRNDRTNQAVLGHESFLRFDSGQDIRVPPKIRASYTSLRNFVPNSGWQVDRGVSKTRRRSSLWITPTTVDALLLDTHSLLHAGRLHPLTPLLRFVLYLLYNLMLSVL